MCVVLTGSSRWQVRLSHIADVNKDENITYIRRAAEPQMLLQNDMELDTYAGNAASWAALRSLSIKNTISQTLTPLN